LGADPDIVVIATGGVPNTNFLDAGAERATTSWEILAAASKPAESAILFDDNATLGTKLEFATPERAIGPDVGGLNYPAYLKAFDIYGVVVTLNVRLERVARDGNKLIATLCNEYSRRHHERSVDQVVVEHGTQSMISILP
jgi:hypothetical protein